MTWAELTARVTELGINDDSPVPVRIKALGGLGRSGVDIESVTIGFDWDHGAILLHPVRALCPFRPKLASDGSKPNATLQPQ